MIDNPPVIASSVHSITLRLSSVMRRPELFTALLIVLVSLMVGAINPAFYQLSTMFDMLRSCTTVGLLALGVLMVLAGGGIDVSFTAIAAFAMYAITKITLQVWPDAPFALILLVGTAAGTLLGSFNGLLVYKLKAPSLIVTIGTQYLFRGVLLTFVGTTFFMDIPQSMDDFGKMTIMRHVSESGSTTAIPATFAILVVMAGATAWLLNRTLMGRAIYAIGGSLSIAERLGYNLRVVQVFVFAYAGALAGVAGIVHVSSNRLANPFDLVGTELDVIAAVILGGARITGGTGSVTGTLLGVVFVTLINNVLILAGIPSTWQKLIIGSFILVAGAMLTNKQTQ